jgi:hypothetical protein
MEPEGAVLPLTYGLTAGADFTAPKALVNAAAPAVTSD